MLAGSVLGTPKFTRLPPCLGRVRKSVLLLLVPPYEVSRKLDHRPRKNRKDGHQVGATILFQTRQKIKS